MDTKTLSRAFLETLSSADLISLADDYGIDVPDDLNRRFLIGELLELSEEQQQEEAEQIVVSDDVPSALPQFPEGYNETQIHLVLVSPVWAFVWWDIKESTTERFSEDLSFSHVLLRVSFFAHADAVKTGKSFDIQIAASDRAQYVHLRAGERFVHIDLVAVFDDGTEELLASSSNVALPVGSELLTTALPGRALTISPLQELSSVRELLRTQFENYRTSFAE